MQIKVKAPQITNYMHNGQDNAMCVTIGELDIYFSYRTVVGFYYPGMGRKVSQNYWSTTTGKHLNAIDGGDKISRLNSEDFERLLVEAMNRAGL